MYTPAHFAETRPEELHRIITSSPLGMLVTHSAKGLDADHVPFELDPARGALGTLTAHVARANPVWSAIGDGASVMVVFRGPAGYVSPNWYPSKHEAHRQVPTWNYEVVHVHGILRVFDDAKYVRGVVAKLTRRHESTEPKPWKMGDAPRDYLDALVQAIVGIEVEIVRFEAKRKLSQNKEERDRDGAVLGARERGNAPLSEAMARARG